MKKKALYWIFIALAMPIVGISQNVGIGTASPNARAILDLQSTSLAFLPPRMNNAQMNGITSPPIGSLVFNTERQQFMGYIRSFANTITEILPPVVNAQWVPVSSGPRILAWGIIDSFPGASIRNGSNNFTIKWEGYKFNSETTVTENSDNHYLITLSGDAEFNVDSMMVHVTPLGAGSWDVAPSVWAETGKIQIKFVDISRIASNEFSTPFQRRRSKFCFTVYDLRQIAR